MSNPFARFGGHVQFVPERVKSDLSTTAEFKDADQIRNIALQRDLTAANLLENDVLLDMLDAAIDDQMKDFNLAAPEIKDAAMKLCNSPTVSWECYKKAKELLRIAPWIANGFDPMQLTFTDRLVAPAGKVVFDCKNFNPDTFFDSADSPTTSDPMTPDETMGEYAASIQKKALENQKKWAMRILFWDLLWGKPEIKPNITRALDLSLDKLTQEVQTLRENGKVAEADALARKIQASENLPETILMDRPQLDREMMWEGRVGCGSQEHLTRYNAELYSVKGGEQGWQEKAASIWLDPASMLTANDVYKDRGIPALKSGFILPILIGAIGLFPRFLFYVIKLRSKILKKFDGLNHWPQPVKAVGKKLFAMIKFFVDAIFFVPVAVNAAFIEACVWLAMLPRLYSPNLSDLEDIDAAITRQVDTTMDVAPTPAGFISLDCFTAAQEIVNRVNQEVVN